MNKAEELEYKYAVVQIEGVPPNERQAVWDALHVLKQHCLVHHCASVEMTGVMGHHFPPATKAHEQPPVDNAHVAEGCVKFDTHTAELAQLRAELARVKAEVEAWKKWGDYATEQMRKVGLEIQAQSV